MEHRSHIYGLVAEFETAEELIAAAEKTRMAGYRRFESYSPFPIEGLSEAMGLKRNAVPLITLIGGLCGGLGAFALEYWVAVIAYPQNIGGRPLNSWPAFIPVTFELTVLGAALAAVFGMLALNGLPRPHHPLFNVKRFSRHVTSDRFYLCIEARDARFHLSDSARFLSEFKPAHIFEVEDD